MDEIELLKLSLNTAEIALSEQIVFRNYLIAALGSVVSALVYVFILYKSSVDKQLDMGLAGFELANSVKDVKDVTKESIRKLEELEKNNCKYVTPIQ